MNKDNKTIAFHSNLIGERAKLNIYEDWANLSKKDIEWIADKLVELGYEQPILDKKESLS